VVAEQLSVRAVEDAVRTRNELGPPADHAIRAEPPKLRPPGVLELEELLASHLDTRVRVNLGNRKGRVVIEFASLEDLERIYRLMTEAPPGGAD
jgi:ParB family chromosome partitioning protein